MKSLWTTPLAGIFIFAVSISILSCGGGESAGGGLTISAVVPPRSGVMGGGTVDISGSHFEAGADVLFGLNASPAVSVIDSSHIQAQVPAGLVGAVNLAVENPSGGVFRLLGGFEYILVGTPNVNGSFSDWDARYELAANSAVGANLESLSACFDSTNLYVAVQEDIITGTGNGVIAWLDVDMGSGDGYTNLASSLNDGTGALDGLMSLVKATITASGFEADAGMGSIDHTAVAGDSGDKTGFRGFGTDNLSGSAADFVWIDSTVSPGSGGLEMAVPLASVFPGGIPVAGRTLGIFVTATASTGDFAALPGQTLPEQLYYGSNTRTISEVVTLRIFPEGQF